MHVVGIYSSMIEAEWRTYASVNYEIIGSDNGLTPVQLKHYRNICWVIDQTTGNKFQ